MAQGNKWGQTALSPPHIVLRTARIARGQSGLSPFVSLRHFRRARRRRGRFAAAHERESVTDKREEGTRSSRAMIQLTRINRVPLVLNSDLIEHVEATPDTVISLTTGQKLVVLESVDEIVRRVIDFRRAVHRCEHWVDPRAQEGSNA